MTEIIATKAYLNADFLNSEQARHIQILCEYEETKQRLVARVRASHRNSHVIWLCAVQGP